MDEQAYEQKAKKKDMVFGVRHSSVVGDVAQRGAAYVAQRVAAYCTSIGCGVAQWGTA